MKIDFHCRQPTECVKCQIFNSSHKHEIRFGSRRERSKYTLRRTKAAQRQGKCSLYVEFTYTASHRSQVRKKILNKTGTDDVNKTFAVAFTVATAAVPVIVI